MSADDKLNCNNWEGMRDERLDVIKGLCILLMVWGHLPRLGTCAAGLERIVGWIYSFHMPVFVVITGYLFGSKDAHWYEVRKVFNCMFKPYLTVSIVSTLLYIFAAKHGVATSAQVNYEGFAKLCTCVLIGAGGGALWYLYAYGMAKLLTMLALFLARGRMLKSEIFSVVVITGGGVFVMRELGFHVAAPLIPYFLIGFFARRFGWGLPNSWWFCIPAIIIAVTSNVRVESVCRLAWVLSLLGIFMSLSSVLNARVGGCLAWIGRHTLAILLFHNIYSVGLRPLSGKILQFEESGIGLNIILLISIVIACVMTEMIWRRIPFFSKAIW